jgi:hypothetical protein
LGFDVPDELVVGEGIEPAEYLAHHPDKRPIFIFQGDGEERVFDPAKPRLEVDHALLVADALAGHDGAHEVKALEVDFVGLAAVYLVGPGLEQQLEKDVLDYDRSPGRADEFAGLAANAGIAVG